MSAGVTIFLSFLFVALLSIQPCRASRPTRSPASRPLRPPSPRPRSCTCYASRLDANVPDFAFEEGVKQNNNEKKKAPRPFFLLCRVHLFVSFAPGSVALLRRSLCERRDSAQLACRKGGGCAFVQRACRASFGKRMKNSRWRPRIRASPSITLSQPKQQKNHSFQLALCRRPRLLRRHLLQDCDERDW